MSDTVLLTALCGASICAFSGGFFVGIMWMSFRIEDRESTARGQGRPGTQPYKPISKIKPYGKHPDMLDNGTHKKE